MQLLHAHSPRLSHTHTPTYILSQTYSWYPSVNLSATRSCGCFYLFSPHSQKTAAQRLPCHSRRTCSTGVTDWQPAHPSSRSTHPHDAMLLTSFYTLPTSGLLFSQRFTEMHPNAHGCRSVLGVPKKDGKINDDWSSVGWGKESDIFKKGYTVGGQETKEEREHYIWQKHSYKPRRSSCSAAFTMMTG